LLQSLHNALSIDSISREQGELYLKKVEINEGFPNQILNVIINGPSNCTDQQIIEPIKHLASVLLKNFIKN